MQTQRKKWYVGFIDVGVRVWHDKGALYLNGKPWSGAWATIANEKSEGDK